MLDTVRCKVPLDAGVTIAPPISDEERITEVPPGGDAARPGVGDARATLMVLTGAQAGRSMALGPTRMTIGRARDADLVVEDAGVSRHHARVVQGTVGGFFVEDLASTNGILVNGATVERALLDDGDRLQLGPGVVLRFGRRT